MSFEVEKIENVIEIFAELIAEKMLTKVDISSRKDKPRYKAADELNTPSAAKYLGKSPGTLRNWQKLHKYLPFQISKETLEVTYKFSDLRNYKERKNKISPNG
jgi:predicted RNA-binding protein Jag